VEPFTSGFSYAWMACTAPDPAGGAEGVVSGIDEPMEIVSGGVGEPPATPNVPRRSRYKAGPAPSSGAN
jgi:hypothetical protein